jgi:hypothetical protein
LKIRASVRARVNTATALLLGADPVDLDRVNAANETQEQRAQRRVQHDISASIQADMLNRQIHDCFREDTQRGERGKGNGGNGDSRRASAMKLKLVKFGSRSRYGY